MDWASNLFIVLLITDITGTIFFTIGQLFRRQADKDVAFLRFLTDATVIAFLIPFVYVILYLNKRISIIKIESGINMFYGTPLMLELTAVLGWVWTGMFLTLLAYRLYRVVRWRMVCRGNIPEEDPTVFKVFSEICSTFGINGKVSLCRNDSVDVPCITYYHGTVVILPLVKYTEKEAEVVICHELCHYLNGDLRLKTISCIAALLHVFNPVVHIMLRQIDMLCERGCDRAACKKGKDMFTKKEYFQVILNSLVSDGRKNRYQLFALADDRSSYERRVEYMVNYHVKGGLKKGTAIVLAIGFLMGSSITSFAAGGEVTDAYKGLADATKIMTEVTERVETVSVTEVANMTAKAYDLDPDSVVIMEDEVAPQSLDEPWHITWTIPPGDTYMSSGFRQYVGDWILVEVNGTPEDVPYETGIKDPKAIMWYTEGEGTTNFAFLVDIKGRHYFFVTNKSETEELHVEVDIRVSPAISDASIGATETLVDWD